MKTISAIETEYRGCRFRSRLEARWAVYFDALGLQWEYELEGWDLGDGLRYLPDFWLPQVRMWAEVKAVPLTPAEQEKARRLAQGTGRSVLMLVGSPRLASYCAFEPCRCWPGCDCAGSGLRVEDYLVTDYHDYPKTEGRFYACTGADIPNDCGPITDAAWLIEDDERVVEAIRAANSARFEDALVFDDFEPDPLDERHERSSISTSFHSHCERCARTRPEVLDLAKEPRGRDGSSWQLRIEKMAS